ncbi:MAG: elongation factor Ts [Alphaproteobacteria bacterium]|nr:elongation factor Ts [Alphaproteobacteria bacterium]
MAEISAALVKELRDKTGAGMMDCKKALNETGANLQDAIDWLRKKGLASAAKKAGRVAADGLIAAALADGKGALVEVNAETDFVARNEAFQDYARTVAQVAIAVGCDMNALKGAAYPGAGCGVAEQATNLIAKIGENIALRRAACLSVVQGVVAGYVHAAVAPNLGKIGVLVALESAGDQGQLQALGKQLAMHIAAAKPESIAVADLDQSLVARERAVLTDQAQESKKPADVIAKMVEGRLRKYYQDVVLMEQLFVIDGESRVSQVVERLAKQLGQAVKVAGFVRFGLGEGIDKGTADFATEVAQLTR